MALTIIYAGLNSSPPYGKIGNSWQSLFIIGKGETMADPEGEILTLDEVAAYLKAGKRTVYRLAAEGKLPAFKLGGTWRFRRSDLDEWIAANLTNKDSGASD
ncbi:methylation-associated defense system helix-turn-helix domain-containing protein MAD1 [Verminephrobacter eiseniae]